MSQPELIIFDFDGVLIDSEIVAARIDAELLTGAGYPIETQDLIELYAGLTFKDILLKVEPHSDVPLKASLIGEEEVLVDRALRRDVRAIEGAEQAVAGVSLKKCICSNSRGERVRFMLEKTRLDRYFGDHVFSSLETASAKPKPSPDVFLHAAAAMGADPESCFVIEDSVHGVTGAKAAGMRVIGFTGGSHTYPGHADVLMDAGAETVIRRWADFAPVLAALSEWSEG